jgi:glycosyltransferase involved in cell wall biosynthesis
MPVYNAEKYLREAVESILNQTFTDFEFLIIDDGSTDGSLAILQHYADRDARIRVFGRSNLGIPRTLNELAERSRGEYIARMDADDISLPERLSRQMEYLHNHPDCVLVASPAQVIDPDGDPVCIWFSSRTHEEIDAHNLLGYRGTALCHPSVLMRREALLRVGGYDESYRLGEDLDLFLKMAEIGRLANLPEIHFKYRSHQTSYTKTRAREDMHDLLRINVEARRRRGLPPQGKLGGKPVERGVPVRNPFETWGWQALHAGNVATARKHACKSLARAPFSIKSWMLFFFSLTGDRSLSKDSTHPADGTPAERPAAVGPLLLPLDLP